MSKNLTRKGLALVSGAALTLTSLVGIAAPANAATGDVVIVPKTGTGTTAFATDNFELTTSIKTSVISATTLAYLIENPDQAQLHVDVTSDNADIYGIKADGSTVSTNLGDNLALGGNGLVVDFVDLDIVSLLIYEMDTNAPAATGNDLVIQLDEGTVTNAAADTAVNPLEYGELTSAVSLKVTAWVETGAAASLANHLSVDADYSSSVDVTFVDPSSVSVVSRVERLDAATGDSGLHKATDVVDHYLKLANAVAFATQADTGDTIDGVVLEVGDTVLVDTNVAGENGIYTVSATTASGTRTTLTTAKYVLVTKGDTNAGKVIRGAADATALSEYSTADTFDVFNAGDDNLLGASLRFSNTAINLNQVDLTQWLVGVDASNADDYAFSHGRILRPLTPAGYSDSKRDGMGRLFVQAPIVDLSASEGETYSVKFKHSGDTVAPILEYVSPGYQVVIAPVGNTAEEIKAAPTTSTDVSVGTHNSGYPVSIRNGLATVTYKSQIMTGSAVNLETANVPVLAVITAGANLPTGATLTVSGTTETIKAAGATQVVSGLTDSKGNWSVSVTSSDTSSAGATYSIQFYVLKAGTTPDAWASSDGTNAALYNADYAGGSLAATGGFTSDSTVLSGAKPTVTFSVKDQFGQPLSGTSTKPYSVELKAPSKTNLEQFVAVVDGKATFTFDNYLKTGESDILTAKLYTGSSTSPSYVAGATVNITLYNAAAVAGVNVPAEVVGVIVTYDDFITGTASATNVAPTDGSNDGSGEDFLYSGTVVDANGAGVPGAPVTITGTGFQFVKDGSSVYSVDSITLAASEAGTFSVRGWTHVASATGNVITVTSGDKSATTKVKSKVEDGDGALSAANLSFTWDLPATLVMNTTYAVTASVTDKWGNPIRGAEIDFTGFAAAQFNGVTTATRTTASNGKATAFLRSLKDVDGISAVGATLKKIDQNGDTDEDVDNLGAVLTNSTATKWDESKWSRNIEAQVNFLKTAPAASAAAGKVNVGSFNGKLVVYAAGLDGAKISWKVAGRWGTAVASGNYDIFDRPVGAAGRNVNVEIYVNGVKQLTKTVLTR